MYVREEDIELLKEFFESHDIPYEISHEHPRRKTYFHIEYKFRVLLYDLLHHYYRATKEKNWEHVLPFLFQPLENFLMVMTLHGVHITKRNIVDLEYLYNRFHSYISHLKKEEES